MVIKAQAKINLFLNVGEKRSDSYHELYSIIVKVSLFDLIEIREDSQINIDAPSWIPIRKNLVYRAASLFFKETGIKKGCSIRLEKNIPAGAGLGGGSSDAAATLKGLNKIFKTGLGIGELEKMGAELGSDVNSFFYEQGCLVSGRGEKVKPLETVKSRDYSILLVDPNIEISTKKIYENYPGGRLTRGRDLDNIIKLYNDTQWPAILRNDLEETVFKIYPSLGKLKKMLENWGVYPLLSGSGSFFFALSRDRKLIETVKEVISKELGLKTHIVQSLI